MLAKKSTVLYMVTQNFAACGPGRRLTPGSNLFDIAEQVREGPHLTFTNPMSRALRYTGDAKAGL